MLVSTIAHFNTLNTMNNSAFASNQAANLGVNAIHAFGGEYDLYQANETDKKYSLDLLVNKLLYKAACLQEKMSSEQQKLDILG